MTSKKYQEEQRNLELRLAEITETISATKEKAQGINDFIAIIKGYNGITELTAPIVNSIIEKITVSEREQLEDGTVKQEIKIYYKFVGYVGEIHIEPKLRRMEMKNRLCAVCGTEYTPKTGYSKYCPACSSKVHREQSNESKRKSRAREREARQTA